MQGRTDLLVKNWKTSLTWVCQTGHQLRLSRTAVQLQHLYLESRPFVSSAVEKVEGVERIRKLHFGLSICECRLPLVKLFRRHQV